MLKATFIKEAKQLGFDKFKDLVVKLGYHIRTLDRYKKDGEITSKPFIKAFEDFKKTGEVAPKEQKPKTTQKKTQKKVVLKKVTKEEKVVDQKEDQIVIHKDQTTMNDFIEEEKETHFDGMTITHKPENDNTGEKIEIKEVKERIEKEIKKEPTAFIDISNDDYHASGKMGSSKLKTLIDNAKEFEGRYITKTIDQKKTDALIIGSVHHTLVMEPHKFDEDYTVLNISSKSVKADYIEAVEVMGGEIEMRENSKQQMVVADTVDQLKAKLEKLTNESTKTICTQTHVDVATQTSQKALESWFEWIVGGKTIMKIQLKTLLQYERCYVEKAFYGVIDGVEVQIKPDILINLGTSTDIWLVIDLKSLEVATPNMFIKQGGAFSWHLQEAFYMEVLNQNGIFPKNFIFNCAGKKEFSGASFYEWGQTTKEDAKKVLKAGFKKYNYCTENNIYLENRFDYKSVRFEAVASLEVPAYIQHQFGDMGI